MDTPPASRHNRDVRRGSATGGCGADRVRTRLGEDVHRPISRSGLQWLPWVVWVVSLAAVSSVGRGLEGASAVEVLEAAGWFFGVVSVATIGALVVSRGRGSLQGWLLVGFSLFVSVGLAAYHQVAVLSGRAQHGSARTAIAAGDVAYMLAMTSLMILLLVVPSGRLPSPRWRPSLWLVSANAAVWIVQSVMVAGKVGDIDAWLARSSWASLEGADLDAAARALTTVGMALGVCTLLVLGSALAVRVRSARGEERQQLKWVVVGGVAILAWWWMWIPEPRGQLASALQSLLPGAALVLFATGFGLALFKYRLWDVDVFVRRSVVYGLLWLAIASAYAAVAAGLGLAAGARFPVEVAIAITVIVTLVFQPVRRRVEEFADRRVFGRTDSPADAMHTLAEAVGTGGRPRDVAAELATVARSAVGLAWVEVEVDGCAPVSVGSHDDGPVTAIVVGRGSERYGTLRCRPYRGVTISDEHRALLEAFAGQAALAISHARLAARIVHAQEQERRRIERDIHDGVQQDVATLVARVGLATSKADGNVAVVESLDGIRREAQRVLADIRELAQGIHPSVLRDGGLVAAIEDRCSRLPIRASISVPESLVAGRFAEDVEAAAYFFVAEAVTNALKHSGSASVDISVECGGGRLRVTVSDAGMGFDPDGSTNGSGSGIRGLSDRIRALGGSMKVSSRPGLGTVLVAELPAAEAGGAPR